MNYPTIAGMDEVGQDLSTSHRLQHTVAFLKLKMSRSISFMEIKYFVETIQLRIVFISSNSRQEILRLKTVRGE